MPPVSQGASVSLACDEQPHRCEVGTLVSAATFAVYIYCQTHEDGRIQSSCRRQP